MIEYIYTHKGKYYDGTGVSYYNSLKKFNIRPNNFPEKELLCMFVQNPDDSEVDSICKNFSIEKWHFDKYKQETRSLRYSFSPLIFTMTDYFTEHDKILTTNLLFIIKRNVLILVVSSADKYFKELFDEVISNTKNRKIKSEAYMLYEFLHQDTKENYDVIELIDDQINALGHKVIHDNKGDHQILEEIVRIKRDLIKMNKRLWASSKIIFTIKKDLTSITLTQEEKSLLDDIYDTLMHQIDLIESLKGSVSDLLEISSTQLSNRLAVISNDLNVVMKKMTALTIIIMIPTLIAGIYGTNFANLPEIHWSFGYPFMLITMGVASWITYMIFHNRQWI